MRIHCYLLPIKEDNEGSRKRIKRVSKILIRDDYILEMINFHRGSICGN